MRAPGRTAFHAAQMAFQRGEPCGVTFGAVKSHESDCLQSPSRNSARLKIRCQTEVFHGSGPRTSALVTILASKACVCASGLNIFTPLRIVGINAVSHKTRARALQSGLPPYMKFLTNVRIRRSMPLVMSPHNAKYLILASTT